MRHETATGSRATSSQFTCCRWRKEFGGPKTDQVKRLKEPETDDARLRKAVSGLALETLTVREAASRSIGPRRQNV